MVYVCNKLLSSFKKLDRLPKFVDTLRLYISGGHGGNGVPKYGGIGGQGGCVYFVAKKGLTLRHIMKNLGEKRVYASPGEDSSKIRILARRGMDTRIEVPLGVQIFDESGEIICELNTDGATCIAAKGGVGGCSGTSFLGRAGDTKNVTIDLKLIADIGLVGFPNAGKSAFLKSISNVSPKIASYPFTTIRPEIGILKYSDYRSVSIADLPGLIEGAHMNIGMGHKFLKHIERTRLLVMIVDVFGFRLSSSHPKRSCLYTIFALNRELELYNKTLLDKPIILLVNKMDINGAVNELEKIVPILNNLKEEIHNCPEEIKPSKVIHFEKIVPISAKTLSNINEVKRSVRLVLDKFVDNKLDYTNLGFKLENKIKENGPIIV